MTNTFTWQQLTIISNQDISEQLNTWLNLLDAEAIENSPDGLVNRALFLPNIAIDQVKVFLQKNISADLAFELKIINNTDWHATQNLDLKPIEINCRSKVVTSGLSKVKISGFARSKTRDAKQDL